MKKKSQLRIQEMAFMLVAVVLFFALAGLFAFSIIFSGLNKQATAIKESQTLSAITNLADSPEFSCGKSKPNCVDFDKVISLSENKNYREFWAFSSLVIIRQSAFKKDKGDIIVCNSQNYPDCEEVVIYDKNIPERTVSSYVALCRNEFENDANYLKCEIARMIAGTELKSND